MSTKKTKETNKSKKTTSKPKTTKKESVKLEGQKVVENIEIKEEEKPVVVEKVMENTVKEVTVEVNINNYEEVNELKENEEVLDNAEIADNTTPEPTEEQISEMKEMANGDDEKFEYARSMMDNVQKVTQQEETNECNDVLNETPKRETQIDVEENSEETANNRTDETTEDEVVSATIEGDNLVLEQENSNTVEVEVSSLVQEENEGPSLDVLEDIVNHEETANSQTNEAEEYKILVDEYGSNAVSVTQGTTSQTCIEEKQVQELAEETKQEVKPKTRWFGRRKFSWMGKIFDI